MTAWLFPRLDAARGPAGDYVAGPYRVVLHTTEVDADPRAWVPGWVYPSHVVCDPARQVIVQCVPLDQAAKALWNEPGGVQTNLRSAIQVEINGHAADAATWPTEWLEWIGREVLAPIAAWCAAQGSPIDLDDVPEPGPIPNSARVDAPQRMPPDRWDTFCGVCGHRHVPENDHWDGGGMDMRAIAAAAKAVLEPAPAPPPIPMEDDDMPAKLYRVDGDNKVWAVRLPFKLWVPDQDALYAWRQAGLVQMEEPEVLSSDIMLRDLIDAATLARQA